MEADMDEDVDGTNELRWKTKGHPKLRNCRCGQEEKVVLFIGCTGNGKSCLIQALLTYGGYLEEAKAIKRGRGSVSCTKEVSTHSAVIEIEEHSLVVDGETLTVDQSTDLDDLDERHIRNVPSGRHIHLRLIDTPGLDDSDNFDASAKSNSSLQPADEKHKLAALFALRDVPQIHAVCLVLSRTAPSNGAAVTKHIKQYHDLLKASSILSSFFFVHTKVTKDKMFGEDMRVRPHNLAKEHDFITENTQHFYLDSRPSDDVAAHFLEKEIARMLDFYAGLTGRTTKRLKYPLCSAHLTMRDDLIMSLDLVAGSLAKDLEKMEPQLKACAELKRLRAIDLSVEEEDLAEVRAKRDALNSNELVEVGYQQEYDDPWFGSARAKIRATARAPIRQVDRKKPAGREYWDTKHWGDQLGQGSYYADLVDPSGSATVAWVRLYGWKKEVRAKSLERAEKDFDEASSSHRKALAQHRLASAQMEKVSNEIEALKRKIRTYAGTKKGMQVNSISLPVIDGFIHHRTSSDSQTSKGEALKDACRNFATTNMICFARGIGATTAIEGGSLIEWEIDQEEYMKACASLREYLENSEKKLLDARAALGELGRGMTKHQQEIQAIETLLTRHIAQTMAQMKLEMQHENAILAGPCVDSKAHSAQLLGLLQGRCKRASSIIVAAQRAEMKRYEGRLGRLRERSTQLDRIWEAWGIEGDGCRSRIDAELEPVRQQCSAVKTAERRIIRTSDEMPLGMFTYLRLLGSTSGSGEGGSKESRLVLSLSEL